MKAIDFLIIGCIVGAIFITLMKKWFNRRIIIKRIEKAKRGEKDAIKLLKAQGFKILNVQERKPLTTYINGKPYTNYVQVDIIAEKRKKKYIAEVKTGTRAVQTTNPNTRRQLLEYYLVYKPEGILLLDMSNKKINEVHFDIIKPFNKATIEMIKILIVFIAGLIAGAIIG
ncbi:hypothetical protein H0A61_02448 [Koleobacter methoxysyntrophicus]|jgi:Holliday junction resolvase-like predicted endonuclease|uniref:PD-(D/E)XK endonuclease-like domain-containing protein n=2 Tax=Koleobacter methoxysyntrophicus TaxID=2751313 RepID=A0A8A0RS96_9FIRM|nr:hypothetical protein [Thermosediminibacterales bacterium]QSQ10056.1 hypothetical protein H0A61_02448 [Koleobacter methoxysyntrophicus]